MVVTAQRREAPVLDAFGPVPVPCVWPGETVVCLGSGPSLTQADVDACRGRARVIAIKDAVRMAPWADVLYGAGSDNPGRTWWHREGPSLTFPGLRYTLDRECRHWASVLGMAPSAVGLSTNPETLALGHHSGYQAMNLAVLLGASKIILLGYDMQPTGGQDHFFGKHPHGNTPPFALFLASFAQIVEPLRELGVAVVNASRDTALTLFPRQPIEEALS